MNGRPLLLTGFEPFEGDPVNPSWLVSQALHGLQVEGFTVQSVQLPCVFGDALHELHGALARYRPQLVLALGLAGGRSELSVERVAINVDDARIADNAGAQPIDRPVVDGAPAAYFSTLPIKAMVHDMRRSGVPAEVSQTAGTFVCNHVFYGLMHGLRRRRGVRGGFMHVPLLPQQAQRHGLPGMDLDTQCQGVSIALRTALRVHVDRVEAGGAIS